MDFAGYFGTFNILPRIRSLVRGSRALAGPQPHTSHEQTHARGRGIRGVPRLMALSPQIVGIALGGDHRGGSVLPLPWSPSASSAGVAGTRGTVTSFGVFARNSRIPHPQFLTQLNWYWRTRAYSSVWYERSAHIGCGKRNWPKGIRDAGVPPREKPSGRWFKSGWAQSTTPPYSLAPLVP